MKMLKAPAIRLLAVIGFLYGARPAKAAAEYSITQVGRLTDSIESHATDINNLGQVAGYSLATYISTPRGFIWENGEPRDLGDLPGGIGTITAGRVNNQGQVIGGATIQLNPGVDHAFIWQNGVVTDLGTLGSNPTTITADLNDKGQVVGRSGITAFIWQNGIMTNFNTLPGAGHIDAVWSINNRGDVAGTMGNPLYQHAVVWSNGSVTDLGDLPGGVGMFLPSGDWSTPSAINDVGQVVGMSDSAAGLHPFLWENGQMIDLGGLPGNWRVGSANDINNSGVVVGVFSGNNMQRPFIWDEKNGLRDLNDLIADNPDGWVLESATAINDLGQIVGEGEYNGQLRGYVLTPLPEPRSFWIATLGAVLLFAYCRAARRS